MDRLHKKGPIALPLGDEHIEKAPRSSRFRKYGLFTGKYTAMAILLVVALVWTVTSPLCTASERYVTTQGVFNWDKLPSLPNLHYVECYDKLQCARLELPLDYWNGTTDKTISLAVLKVPATVEATDPRYRGPILINPGGPGGSGVNFVYGAGKTLAAIVQDSWPDLKDPQYYDIVGFDPRGVGLTLPQMTCSGNSSMTQAWSMRIMEEGSMNSSDAAFGRLWAMNNVLSGHCSDADEFSIQRYMSTAYVARDMLELVEASQRLHNKKLLASGVTPHVAPKNAMIQYWGFSYGTYLGYTFAAMFPDRVGRLIVDGVVDSQDYVQAMWLTNLVDAEKVWDAFFHYCAKAGFPACPLAEASGKSSADEVKTRVSGIIQRMWHNPVPLLAPYADVITWSDVRNLIFGALYSPVREYPEVAKALAGLESGDATMLGQRIRESHHFSCGEPPADAANDRPQTASDPFVISAIMCTDGVEKLHPSQEDFRANMSALMAASPNFGDIWATVPVRCLNYHVRALYRFAGPFEGNTANPVLFIGNTADPVTPLVNCQGVSKGYKGARCLTQDSPGHCSIAAYSACTHRYISRYFATGEMPDEGTVCQADTWPWHKDGLADALDNGGKEQQMLASLGEAHWEAGGILGGKLGKWKHGGSGI